MKLLLFTFITTLLFCNTYNSSNNKEAKAIEVKNYQTQINHIKTFAKNNAYNQNVAIMIDYSLHSGRNQFFIVDLKNEVILTHALVCHGNCKGKNSSDLCTNFSNEANSYCTTLGMALIGERDYSTWGSSYKYWLDGLEDSNKNLRSRVVVLHSWEGVKDEEIYPNTLAMSWGCPTISLKMLAQVDELLKNEKKVLLYSFN
ncbi:murein L,D-transpeptidase catalytic domain-containing protein [Flavobacterium sp.]|uniref:murein L,D-transpeptidase catalytic domain-containing protein n=1 Tax=Flavobacterium sp. TaxID=239 RepID=UPI00260B8C5B|nr:murein L,D-transpeptidase catalytic domain family protein [Flavobacterium sp.]MDD3005795.1 murein L,D-transpeptidase catalytic domain family protein [Flavobacterium sp.]